MSGQLSQQQSVLVSNGASTMLLGTNPKRTGLLVFSPTGNRVSLSFGSPAVLDAGPTIQPGVNPVRFADDDVGELIQRAIFGIAATAPTQLSFVEEFDY